ncbi:AraC-like DNA-binding protein [Scopulibacillus darangshiensis]|uniref:AraC-like DNA-binding protein n=1 Tax=Scopulibacillus darangshiensis TaxID=442528 RepID=A0A4R2P7P3_9BACL|nr:helix-turn-helix domain-containing protein [Scopulibacillus darangshiensis]TCP30960.1 AraC-like DNA-binding protein [Scopulibacillus darangshiensis]
MKYLFHLPRVYSAIHLTAIQYSSAQKGWMYPKHRHPYFEFLYCVKGELQQTVNGQHYILNEGDAMIIPSNMYHETKILSECMFFDFHFDVELPEIHEIFQITVNPVIERDSSSLGTEIQDWVDKFIQKYSTLLIEIDDEETKKDRKNNIETSIQILQMHSNVVAFISRLAEFYFEVQREDQHVLVQPSHTFIAHEIAYLLQSKAEENFHIGELSTKLNVHRSHITNCFKKVYGMTPKAYLSQLRLQKAKQYLLETDLPVERIAVNLAFSSTGHFTRFFCKQVGITPLKYRNKHSATIESK